MTGAADAVVIGGGVIGCAIAYHLARKGLDKVVLVEKGYLACGSTGRCGAGFRQQFGTEVNCRLAIESVRAFERMEQELEPPWDIELKQGGYLLLAYSEAQWEQFQKNVRLQRSLGIPVEMLTPEEARQVVPMLNTEGLVGATFCPTDGHANPFRVTHAYAEAARRLGARICPFTEATGIETAEGRVIAVHTTAGRVPTPVVVNAAGPHADEIARMVGTELPIRPERHQILVTEPVAPTQGPMVISFHHQIYCQQTPHGSFLMGLADPREPKDHSVNSTWEFLEKMARLITWLLPGLGELRVVRQWAGSYEVTPDAQPVLGEVPGASGFYVAAGFSGHGFMMAPAVGRQMADLIAKGICSPAIAILDYGRFARGELAFEPSVV